MNDTNLDTLCERLGYTFRDASLLRLALTHRSHANEQPGGAVGNNERLEFLGDAVLDMVLSEMLMEAYPDVPEGELSRMRASLVSEPALAALARELGLGPHLLLDKGERLSGGDDKDSILSDALEAIIAAVYLDSVEDGSLREIRALVAGLFRERLRDAASTPHRQEDFKTALQELIQARYKDTVHYVVVNEEGPDHAKSFESAVIFRRRELGRGWGRSKKVAEQEAARLALESMSREGSP